MQNEIKEYWVIPCNTKRFNVIEHFRDNKTVVWRNAFSIHKGDVVYIYLSAPYSEIRFRCDVVSENVDDETLQNNQYAIPTKMSNNYFSKRIKYIVLEVNKEYKTGTLRLEILKEHGLGQVQIQARAERKLREYLLAIG